MEYRKLGNTDTQVSVICLGTMTYGQQNTEAEAHEQLDFAMDQGVNFIDTAELYPVPANAKTSGKTEAYIGTWIKKTGKRDSYVLASKICGPGPYTEHIRKDKDFNSQSIISAVEGSLKRLQTDYLDLYQIHWPARRTNFFSVRGYHHSEGWKDNIAEIVQTLDNLVKSGKIRYGGVSNETPWGVMQYLNQSSAHNLSRPVSIQNPYSLLNRTFEVGLAEMAIREQIGLLAYSPMAFGRLSGKYELGTDSASDRINQFATMARYNSPQSIEATKRYLSIAQKYNMTLAEMSLAFVNSREFVTSNIIGATSMAQLKENINSIQVSLSKECIKEIEAVHQAIPDPAP